MDSDEAAYARERRRSDTETQLPLTPARKGKPVPGALADPSAVSVARTVSRGHGAMEVEGTGGGKQSGVVSKFKALAFRGAHDPAAVSKALRLPSFPAGGVSPKAVGDQALAHASEQEGSAAAGAGAGRRSIPGPQAPEALAASSAGARAPTSPAAAGGAGGARRRPSTTDAARRNSNPSSPPRAVVANISPRPTPRLHLVAEGNSVAGRLDARSKGRAGTKGSTVSTDVTARESPKGALSPNMHSWRIAPPVEANSKKCCTPTALAELRIVSEMDGSTASREVPSKGTRPRGWLASSELSSTRLASRLQNTRQSPMTTPTHSDFSSSFFPTDVSEMPLLSDWDTASMGRPSLDEHEKEPCRSPPFKSSCSAQDYASLLRSKVGAACGAVAEDSETAAPRALCIPPLSWARMPTEEPATSKQAAVRGTSSGAADLSLASPSPWAAQKGCKSEDCTTSGSMDLPVLGWQVSTKGSMDLPPLGRQLSSMGSMDLPPMGRQETVESMSATGRPSLDFEAAEPALGRREAGSEGPAGPPQRPGPWPPGMAPAAAAAPGLAPALPPGPRPARSCQPQLRRQRAATSRAAGEAHLAAHLQQQALDEEARRLLTAGIAKNRFCTGLSSEQVEAVVATMRLFALEAGDVVVRQGEPGRYFFVAQEGILEVTVDGRVSNTLVGGCTFGDVALLYNCPRTATVTAKSPCKVWGADGDVFRRVLKEQAQKRHAENRELLDRIRLFDGLSSLQKELVTDSALVIEDFEAGERVVAEGEAITGLYFVKSGELSVVQGSRIGACGKAEGGVKVATLRRGDVFGERAALYGVAQASTVVAEVKSELLCIGVPQLKDIVGGDLATCLYQSVLPSVLQNVPVLSHLEYDQQRRLAEAMVIRSYSPEQSIEEGSWLVIVVDGQINSKGQAAAGPLQRGDWWADGCVEQVHGTSSGSGASTAPRSRDVQLSELCAGPSGCKVACLSRESLLSTLEGLGVTGLSSITGDEDLADYVKKVLLAKKILVFRDLSEEQVDGLIGSVKVARYMKGEKVLEQGDVGCTVYMVGSGEVSVSRDGKHVRTLGQGTCFGERAVLFGEPRTATVEVTSSVAELWSVQKSEFCATLTEAMRSELVNKIQLQDTVVSLKGLRHIKHIGAGAFGSVRLVEHRQTQMRYALKRVRKVDGKIPNDVRGECDLLAELDHPFVLRLVKTFETHKSVYILTELITGGQLFMQTNQKMGILSRKQVQFYVGSLVVILEALHDRHIAYRDLKPENVMLDAQGYLKLVDFGLAKKLDAKSPKTFSLVGTIYYMAPEVIRGKGYGLGVDVWSLGVLFYELVCGRLPFGEGKETEHDIFTAVLDQPLSFPGRYGDHAGKKLIQAMLCRQPELRAGATGWESLKSNKFFSAGLSGNLFSKIIGRELEPPVVPEAEEFPPEADLERKVSLSDAEELADDHESLPAKLADLLRRVKTGAGGRSITKRQLGRILQSVDTNAFNDTSVERIWEAVGGGNRDCLQPEDVVKWICSDAGATLRRTLELDAASS